jgi:hypothetical protein
MAATIAAAVAALLTAVSGIIFTTIKFRDERAERERQLTKQEEGWRTEFGAQRQEWSAQQRAALRTQFLSEVVNRRLDTFADVLVTLGAVRDISDPKREHYTALESDRERLQPIADQLIAHLYGPPGLVMSMRTRNQLLSTLYTCQRFIQSTATIEDRVSEFFKARRELRADVQIDDSVAPITVSAIEKSLGPH